jgi:hypothetical protein
VNLTTTVDPSRPKVSLLSKSVENASTPNPGNIQLAGQDELPQNSKLVFSLKTQSPAAFTHEEKIEVATADGAYSTTLNMGDGTLVLQDAKTALATLDPSKAFGSSAFGPLQFRVIDGTGAQGDWQPLVTLVRLPTLQGLQCPPAADQPCSLTGSGLFLLDSVSTDAQFTHPVQVPDGFPGNVLSVPHPEGQGLYVKLRDDPAVVNVVTLPAVPLPPTKAQAAAARQSRRAAAAAAAAAAATASQPSPTPAPSSPAPPPPAASPTSAPVAASAPQP